MYSSEHSSWKKYYNIYLDILQYIVLQGFGKGLI